MENNLSVREKMIKLFTSDNMKKRMMSILILVPLTIFIVYGNRGVFETFLMIIAILMEYEWMTITKTAENHKKWLLFGMLYIIIPILSLLYIKTTSNGADIIMWLLLVVWATDIGGMLVGSSIGGPKLAPKISPSKTWSGLGGGVIASMLMGICFSFAFQKGILFFMLFSGFLAVIEQLGDLLESKVKRIFGVKDSGNLIPGHGGILDRIDGLTFVAPIIAIIVMFSDKIF